MSDLFARRFGIGGRLITVVFNLFFVALPTFTFCFFLERNLYATVAALFFGGFCLSFPRSGALTFAIEKVPFNAAGVSCSFTSLQFALAFVGVTVATFIYEHYGLLYFAVATLPFYLLFGTANAWLLYRYMTSYDVVGVSENVGRDIEMGEKKDFNSDVLKEGSWEGEGEVESGRKRKEDIQEIEINEKCPESPAG